MERNERLHLLHKIASTVNHDRRGYFVPGETNRLDLIQKYLLSSGYHLTRFGLCHLYSKAALSDLPQPFTIISSHVDTHEGITKPFSEVYNEKKLCGTYDNGITNAAILTLMLEGRLPDSVVIAFTGNEENGMRGAEELADFLKQNHYKANVIVTDVTFRGYEEKNVFSIENRCNSGRWTKDVSAALMGTGMKYGVEGTFYDDETAAYSAAEFECFSLCIPTKGKMHSNAGLKTKTSTYDKYIEALLIAAGV